MPNYEMPNYQRCRVCKQEYLPPKWIRMDDDSGRMMRTCCKKPNITLEELKKIKEEEPTECKTWVPPSLRK